MKLLITGGKGMIGRTLQNGFRDYGIGIADTRGNSSMM